MTEFAGAVLTSVSMIAYYIADDTASNEAFERDATTLLASDNLADNITLGGERSAGGAKTDFTNDAAFAGQFFDVGMPDWYEDFHILARSYDFGNLLSSTTTAIVVFSAFRSETHTWTSLTNNAGEGISLTGLPSLPTTVAPFEEVTMVLNADVEGDAFVDGSLDFVFDNGSISVPITIQRIVLFGLEPEMPFTETLESVTDIIRSKNGTEKRTALRESPRQLWNYTYIIQEGTEKQMLENVLFNSQARTFGVPIWKDDTALTAAAAIDDTTISVGATIYRDFRAGGLVIILTDQSTFDVAEITTVNSTSLVLASALVNAYAIGTQVFPLLTCVAQARISGARSPVGISRLAIRFESTDNDVDFASITPFSLFNSKVLLDGGNSILGGQVPETFEVEFLSIDSVTGQRTFSSEWDRHKRIHQFSLRTNSRQTTFEMRGLVYALRGRQVSFYVPRGSDDFEVTTDLINGGNLMVVSKIDYTRHVQTRSPKNVIRLTQTDGTVLLRTIASSESSTTTETLTLDSNWPTAITVDEIERVELVEKVRFDTDSVAIEYGKNGSLAHLVVPLKTVFE